MLVLVLAVTSCVKCLTRDCYRSNDMAEPMQVKESHAAQGAGGEGAQHTKAGWRLWSGPWKPTPIGVVAS